MARVIISASQACAALCDARRYENSNPAKAVYARRESVDAEELFDAGDFRQSLRASLHSLKYSVGESHPTYREHLHALWGRSP